jgi:beta-galactosidase
VLDGSLLELPAVINFGTGAAKRDFTKLEKLRPSGPFMNGEYWAGWFDHWGEKHHTTDAQKQADDLAWMLAQGYSVSIYMFHGGTSFGWMNGANSDGKNYEPDTTSYDYDAPLDESGRPTAKYFLFRSVIDKATDILVHPVLPSIDPPIAIPAVKLTQSAVLWRNLGARVRTDHLLTMEDLGQAYGYILYRTFDTEKGDFDLVLDGLHDYARVYVNESLVGTLDRRLDQNHLSVHLPAARSKLDILVENTGRVNFTTVIRGERKGITNKVTLGGKPVAHWEIYSLPMDAPEKEHFIAGECAGPCFYRGTLQVERAADTFLDTSKFTKGFVWVNGHALGRIWNIGPQKTLYLPGPWLKQGSNDVIVFDLEGGPGRSVEGKSAPVLDGTASNE